MRFKDLKAIGFGSAITRPDTGKRMAKVALTAPTMILGHPQMQGEDLITLTRVLERAQVSGFDTQTGMLAVHAGRPDTGPRPHLNALMALYTFNLKPRYAYNSSCVGHR